MAELLEQIEFWNINSFKDCEKLLTLVVENWPGQSRHMRGKFHFWSDGNEDCQALLDAMRKNGMFWAKAWRKSTRSGHHVFKPKAAK